MNESRLIPARDAATLLGCRERTRPKPGDTTGKTRPTNHSKFLDRLRKKFPDSFPTPVWEGDRKYFDVQDVLAFKASLPKAVRREQIRDAA